MNSRQNRPQRLLERHHEEEEEVRAVVPSDVFPFIHAPLTTREYKDKSDDVSETAGRPPATEYGLTPHRHLIKLASLTVRVGGGGGMPPRRRAPNSFVCATIREIRHTLRHFAANRIGQERAGK